MAARASSWDTTDMDASTTLLRLPAAFGNVTIEGVISVLFTLVFIWWLVYTLVAIYHWFRYGRSTWVAVPAVALHLAVSGGIFIYMTAGLH